MCKKFRFHTQIFKKSPYRGRGEITRGGGGALDYVAVHTRDQKNA